MNTILINYRDALKVFREFSPVRLVIPKWGIFMKSTSIGMAMKVFLAIIISPALWAQGGALISNDLPEIVPPSPTVAAFMKFEEVPVNNYTGIPDISIPLFSTGTHSKDISLNLSLNYHPSGIKVEEQASYVGLGWNFFGGGTISRTVRGLPDEHFSNENGGRTHYGIHQNGNPYYLFEDSFGENSSEEDHDRVAEFLYETHEKGKYDSEHDLYQFNFMGHSGRFYISRKNGIYEVIPLDDNPIKIIYTINQSISADPEESAMNATFTLYDEKGYKFLFDVKEITEQSSYTGIRPFGNGSLPSNSGLSSPSGPSRFVTAFHLSKIYDQNGNLLIEYYYNTNIIMPEYSRTVSTTFAKLKGMTAEELEIQCPGQSSVLEPQETRVVSQSNTETKKITKIVVKDIATIDFSMSKGRMDSDNKEAYKLDGIKVKNYKNEIIKDISFKYDYTELRFSYATRKRRLSLSSVNFAYGTDTLAYMLSYVDKNYNFGVIGTDYWGYPTGISNYKFANKRATNPEFCTLGVLQKMTLPTGGAVLYSFESNKYSYVGDEAITDFSENPDNWHCYTTFESFDPGLQQWDPFNPVNPTDPFDPDTPPGGSLPGGPDENDPVVIVGTKCDRKDKDYKFLYGGGLRISKIGFFENGNIVQDYYEVPLESLYEIPPPPVKEKIYTYDFFDKPGTSSGALVFPKPIYESVINRITFYPCSSAYFSINTFDYETSTSFNNLKALNTHGADVGYKNVQVEEAQNGYSRFTYTSPIDKPEVGYSLTFPFTPSPNYDYQRGLLKKEAHYDLNKRILKEANYEYYDDLSEHEIVTGYQIYSDFKCPLFYAQNFDFTQYYSKSKNCINNNPGPSTPSGVFCEFCLVPASYIGYYQLWEAYGWRPLKQKKSKDYFYEGSNTQIVENQENFTYNDLNKMISSHTTYTYKLTEKLQKEYSYYTRLSTNNIGNVEQIITKKDDQIIANQKIIYGAKFYPLKIQGGKGISLEDKVEFITYDDYGNVLDAKKPNGKYITYIYGYNKTMPIAMIEGMSYNEVFAACGPTITAAIGISDDLFGTMDNLNSKLHIIRSALPGAMVTTYTYKPLVGVTSVTDPKGFITTYSYDAQGRLIEVRDHNGYIVSENKYNSRMQF